MSKIAKKLDLNPDDALLVERYWFMFNFHCDGPYYGTYDPQICDRQFTASFDSEEIKIPLLQHCYYRLMGYTKPDNSIGITALRTVNEMILAGIETLGAEHGDELVEKVGQLLRRQYAKSIEPNASNQWVPISFPVFMRSKNPETLWNIKALIHEIESHTQWTPQRIINEAFTEGLKRLTQKKCRMEPKEICGSGNIAGETPVWIYGLIDPRDGEIHYVGRSKQPFIRLEQHLKDARNGSEKGRWLTSLTEDDLQPDIRILDCVAESEADTVETEYINAGLSKRWPLTNVRGAK